MCGGSGHGRFADGLAVDVQCVASARRHRGRPVLAAACVLHIPLIVIIPIYLPADKPLAALHEAEFRDRECLLTHAVGYRAGLRGRRVIFRLVILHGKFRGCLPLSVEMYDRAGHGRLADRLAVDIQCVTAARRNFGRPVLAAACVLYVPLVIVLAMDLPPEEFHTALREAELLDRVRLLAHAVRHFRGHRRRDACLCLVVFDGEGVDFLPLRIEVCGGSRHGRLADRLAVPVQRITAARRNRRCPVGAAARILYIPLVIIVAEHPPSDKFHLRRCEAEFLDRERRLTHAVGHGAGLLGRCGIFTLVVFDRERVRSIPLRIEVNRGSDGACSGNRLTVHVQSVASAGRHRRRPGHFTVCVLHIPFSVVFPVYLPSEEPLAGLDESELRRRERLLRVTVDHFAGRRRRRRGVRLMILDREGDGLRPERVSGLLNVGRHLDLAVCKCIAGHCAGELLLVSVCNNAVLFAGKDRVLPNLQISVENINAVGSRIYDLIVAHGAVAHILDVNAVGSAVGDHIFRCRNNRILDPHSVVAGIIDPVAGQFFNRTVRDIDARRTGFADLISRHDSRAV